jgi:hypothetical protein
MVWVVLCNRYCVPAPVSGRQLPPITVERYQVPKAPDLVGERSAESESVNQEFFSAGTTYLQYYRKHLRRK